MKSDPDTPPRRAKLPVIVLVGRTNVGKSTLFNRLTRTRRALVTPVPGTTRDRREGEVRRDGYHFLLVDTGGMGFGITQPFSAQVEAQIATAVQSADFIWLVLDAVDGLNPFDHDLHRWVIRCGKPCSVLVNKADNPARRADLSEYYRLGIEDIFPVSALHGSGLEDVLEATGAALPAMRPADAAPAPDAGLLKVAFVGRPNVGKSSLVNHILGEARMIVAPEPGTTREAVDTSFSLYGRDYVLIDTAGMRRKARTKEYLEKIGVLQSLGALNRVQVAVLVLDASEAPAVQDARIANQIVEHGRAVVVALNKWDRVGTQRGQGKSVEEQAGWRLRFIDYAARVRTCALDGSGMEHLFREIEKAAAQFKRQIQTADLNRMVQAAVLRNPPPAKSRSETRIYYGVQMGNGPPVFRFYTNHPAQISEAYTRFFDSQLRYHFGLKGTPVRIEWRGRRESRQTSARFGSKQAPSR